MLGEQEPYGFLKWGYPQILPFSVIFHNKPPILGFPPFQETSISTISPQNNTGCNNNVGDYKSMDGASRILNRGSVPHKAIEIGGIPPCIALKHRPYIWLVPPINWFLKWPLNKSQLFAVQNIWIHFCCQINLFFWASSQVLTSGILACPITIIPLSKHRNHWLSIGPVSQKKGR